MPAGGRPPVSAVHRLADDHIECLAELDPNFATAAGLPGRHTTLTDYSPDGVAARADLDRSSLVALDRAPMEDDRDRVAAEVMRERLALQLDMFEAGEPARELRVIFSPLQVIRQVFDMMPRATVDDWADIAARVAGVPTALTGLRALLAHGAEHGMPAARRQALACAEQAALWAGERGPVPFFAGLDRAMAAAGVEDAAVGRDLARASGPASAAYGDMARWLRDDYAPRALDRDDVGPERYRLLARSATGMDLDVHDTYVWAWDELGRIEAEMAATADRIAPGLGVDAAIEVLESDPALVIDGADALRGWLQDLMDRTVDELDGVHFDIPGPVRRVEAMIAPPGSAAAMYYTGPSEDFSRPGRTWYPTLGRTRFPLWGEVSIAYHEGVPGHHLQIAQVRHLGGQLTRFQRTAAFSMGHAEGWALYAERLMAELGHLADPGHYLGMLRAQALRAVRVVVDIGMHLRLAIPARSGFHPGERWDPALGLEFCVARSRFPADFMASELVRYLGWPAQAISYKVGERVWLGVREELRTRPGFDLKAFHRRALDLGPMGLDQLRRELLSPAGAGPAAPQFGETSST